MKSISILLAIGTLAAANVQAGPQIYDVDPNYRQEVYEVLRDMLDVGDSAYGGKVSILPTGQLLVDTWSDERQAQVAEILAAIAASDPAPTPTVTLRYWILQGEPGADDAPGLPSTLGSVIDELEDLHGDLGFTILDAATVSGQSGNNAFFETNSWEIMQEVIVNGEGDRLNAHLFVETNDQELMVDLTINRGEFIVLGAGTMDDVAGNGVRALVVNWPER